MCAARIVVGEGEAVWTFCAQRVKGVNFSDFMQSAFMDGPLTYCTLFSACNLEH